jgi:hypothetical protein
MIITPNDQYNTVGDVHIPHVDRLTVYQRGRRALVHHAGLRLLGCAVW